MKGLKKEIKKDKYLKRIKRKIDKFKERQDYYEDTTAIFILGLALSATGFLLLFFGGGVLSVLAGIFGGLLCLLAYKSSDAPLVLIGVLLGVIGMFVGVVQVFKSRD